MKVDITSSMVEKAIDLAKDFLGKLIGPTIEEIGLLAKDQVTLLKFKNQIKILNKAKAYCDQHNISPKVISLKILCPLLENAALEDNEALQNKWATLLSNMVDTDQNIDNHVFPYLLSQISVSEFIFLEQTLQSKIERITSLNKEICDFDEEYDKFIEVYNNDAKILGQEIEIRRKNNINNPWNYISTTGLQSSLRSNEFRKELMKKHMLDLSAKVKSPQVVDERSLKAHELGNLIRLGIIKSIQKSYIKSEPIEIPNEPESESVTVDLEIEILTDFDDHILTPLGELFIEACSDKKTR